MKHTIIALSILACFSMSACEPKTLDQSKGKQEETIQAKLGDADAPKPIVVVHEPSAQAAAPNDDVPDDETAKGATLSRKKASEVLQKSLKIKEDMTVIDDGVGTIEGKTCYLYLYGELQQDHFVTLEHFAVCDEGSPLVMDVVNGGDYVPYVTPF